MINIKLKVTRRDIQFFCLFLYILSLTAFNLGTGFDSFFGRGSFIVLFLIVILFNRKLMITSLSAWYVVFAAFYFLSILWASSVNDTFHYANNFIQIIGLSFCLPVIIRNKKDLDLTLNIIILALLGTVIRLVLMTPRSAWGTERLGDAIGLNSNGLGMMLAFGALISLYMLIRTNRSEHREIIKVVTYVLLIALFLGISLFTGSRKSFGIIVLGLAAYAILITKGWSVLLRVLIIVIVVAVFLYFIFSNEVLYSILGYRLENMLVAFTGQGSGGTSMMERAYYRRQAIQLFFQHPVFGYGGNNFLTYMQEINYSHPGYSHNNYTELLSTLGLIGFSIYYFFWVLTGFRLVRKFLKEGDAQILLFMIIVLLEFVLDYWLVSYIYIFIQLLFMLAFIANRLSKMTEKLKN